MGKRGRKPGVRYQRTYRIRVAGASTAGHPSYALAVPPDITKRLKEIFGEEGITDIQFDPQLTINGIFYKVVS